MSSMNERIITGLLIQATQTMDPEELEKIAKKLDKLSAWEASASVRSKAARLERRLAEQAAR